MRYTPLAAAALSVVNQSKLTAAVVAVNPKTLFVDTICPVYAIQALSVLVVQSTKQVSFPGCSLSNFIPSNMATPHIKL
jgi:hypothetical protein